MKNCEKILKACYCYLAQFLKNVQKLSIHCFRIVKQLFFTFAKKMKNMLIQVVWAVKALFLRITKRIMLMFKQLAETIKKLFLQTTKFVRKYYYSIIAIVFATIISTLILIFGLWSNNQYQDKQNTLQNELMVKEIENDSIKIEILNNQKLIKKRLDTICIKFSIEEYDSSTIHQNNCSTVNK